MQREYNLGIPMSGSSLFNPEMIETFAIGTWLAPRPKRSYLVGIDPNFGGSDFFCALVFDITEKPYQLVSQYRDNSHSNTYHREKLLTLLDWYQPEVTAVESNSGGMVILENLVRDRPTMRFEKVNTSSVSKRVNTDRLAIALEAGDIIYPPDWEGIGEMRNFSTKDRKAVAGHDDCIMAWAAAWVWVDEFAIDDSLEKAYG